MAELTVRSVNWMSNARAKFCPSSCEVPICSALPSRITPSHDHEISAPANFSRSVLRPRKTGIASSSTIASA